MAVSPQRLGSRTMPDGEIITVLGPGEANLPRRRLSPGPTTAERFVAILGSLADSDTAVAELDFTKALEARSPATLRAMTCDLESYALFASALPSASSRPYRCPAAQRQVCPG